MIEIQYRTVQHHAWATANEVFTMLNPDQRTKFAQADDDYMEFFRLISEMFARVFDNANSLYPHLKNKELIDNLSEIEDKTRLENKLRHLNEARDIIRKTTVVLRFTSDKMLFVHEPSRTQDIMKYYFKIEADFPGDDVVLVNAPDTGGIRSAYRNYFSDTTEFFSYLDTARKCLSA